MTDIPSVKRANKAGDRLRYAEEGRPQPGLDIADERAVLAAWRSQFKLPMGSTTMTIRSAVRTVVGECLPGQAVERFKREEQIVAKLVRSKTRLSKMEDIGGCRAVLDDIDAVYSVRDRIRDHARSVEILDEDDYILRPRPGGYRALHLHVLRAGAQIEVQLRTRRQHMWADSVETWDATTGHDIKHEAGPPDVVTAFRFSAEMLAEDDRVGEGSIWANLMKKQSRKLLTEWMEGQEDFRWLTTT